MIRPVAESGPGFQGSETSWAQVIIYKHNDDPVLLSSEGAKAYPLDGKTPMDSAHSIIGVTTTKTMGAASGQFTIQLKPSKLVQNIFSWLADDEWVDIIFYRHDRPWHVMRGLTDDIRRSRTVTGRGATATIFTITGRDFAKVWESTPVWFSPYANNDLVQDAVAHQVFQAMPAIIGPPPDAIEAFLKSFLEEIKQNSGVNWTPPNAMPGIHYDSFLRSLRFDSYYFQGVPPRKGFNPNYMMLDGTLWQLAKKYSDPLFCEFYADLLPDGGDSMGPSLSSGKTLLPEDTTMTVVIRDKPFPVSFESSGSGVDEAYRFSDWWDKVPIAHVPRQQITSSDIGRTGGERFNTYYVASLLHQESLGKDALFIIAPLVNLEEIKRHGMRRMDVQSQMSPTEDKLDFARMAESQRIIARDWYCLNPYMLSGTINLNIGRPEIKIGMRARIPGIADDDSDDETYYVESVTHNYLYPSGIKTQLGVTRGWLGTDDSYRSALQDVVLEYDVYTAKLRKDS